MPCLEHTTNEQDPPNPGLPPAPLRLGPEKVPGNI
jgi:hypothetical protein